jgi:hypothetical protein
MHKSSRDKPLKTIHDTPPSLTKLGTGHRPQTMKQTSFDYIYIALVAVVDVFSMVR